MMQLLRLVLVAALSAAALGCTEHTACGDCVKDLACNWCGDQANCQKGDVIGPAEPEMCTSWQWAQCEASGEVMMWVAVGVAGVVLILLIWCIVYCCRRRSRRKKEQLMRDYTRMFDETAPPKENTSWSNQRDEMSAKYGLVNNKTTPY